MSKPIICEPGCFPLQCISKSLFILSADLLVRISSARSNAKGVSQTEHIHAIGLFVWSLKTAAVRTGIAIVFHGTVTFASPVGLIVHHCRRWLLLSCPGIIPVQSQKPSVIRDLM